MAKCEHHENFTKLLDKIEKKVEKNEEEISTLKSKADVSDEKFNNIMAVLSELKTSVNDIAISLSETQKRPIDLFWKVFAAILVAVILFGLGIN